MPAARKPRTEIPEDLQKHARQIILSRNGGDDNGRDDNDGHGDDGNDDGYEKDDDDGDNDDDDDGDDDVAMMCFHMFGFLH